MPVDQLEYKLNLLKNDFPSYSISWNDEKIHFVTEAKITDHFPQSFFVTKIRLEKHDTALHGAFQSIMDHVSYRDYSSLQFSTVSSHESRIKSYDTSFLSFLNTTFSLLLVQRVRAMRALLILLTQVINMKMRKLIVTEIYNDSISNYKDIKKCNNSSLHDNEISSTSPAADTMEPIYPTVSRSERAARCEPAKQNSADAMKQKHASTEEANLAKENEALKVNKYAIKMLTLANGEVPLAIKGKLLSETDKIKQAPARIAAYFKAAVNDELSDVLSSVGEQYEAMNYAEMEYMLSKHSHLAETRYQFAHLSFGQGLACFMEKKFEESFGHFQEAESILQEYSRDDDAYLNDLSLCLMYMGDAESNQGHHRSALDYFDRAILAHRQHGTPSQFEKDYKQATTCSAKLSKKALSYRNDDQIVESERYYRRAVSCSDATPTDRISALTGLGNLLHSVGSNDKAVTEYIAAIELAEKEKEYLSLAWAHGNLGNTYLSLGRKEKGLSHLQTSLELTLEHDPDPSSISRALNNLGTAYQSLNELDEAELYFDQALSQAIYANDHIGQARAYGNIGNVYMLLKDFLKAIPHYTEVLRLSRDRSTVYVAYHNRGCALFELAEKKKGEQYHFMKRGEFQFIAIGPDTGDMEYKHQPEEEMEEHTTELYQQALKDLRKVTKNVESTFSNASSSTTGLDLYLSLFHINAKTFQRGQDCAFNLRDHYLSLTIAEQVRARTLGELLLKRKSHQLPTSFTTPLNIDQIKLAVELLPDPYTPVVVLSYTGTRLLVWVLVFDGKMVSINSFEQEPDDELFDKSLDMYLRYELAEALTGNIDLYGVQKEKEEDGEDEGEETEESEAEVMSNTETNNGIMVQGKMEDNDEIDNREREEAVTDNDNDIAALALSNNESQEVATVKGSVIGPENEVARKKGTRKRGGKRRKKRGNLVFAKRKILLDLDKMIIKPVQSILKAVIPESILQSRGPHKIILIPDNTTKMIPFNALLDEEGGAYFGDKYVLQFFPSVLSLGIMSQAPPTIIRIREHTTEEVLIVGDPSTPSFKFEGEDWTPGPLPHAKKEAEWVGHYLRTPPLLGEEPTKEVIKSRLSQSKLIHLATHGSASHGFVVLAGHCYNRLSTLPTSYRYTEDQDKLLLYSSEIESLCLRSPLVILSSCDSGRGRFKGDEIQGMSRSFLLAGAAAVMTSLWKVPDQSASYFMQFFYRYLLDGHTSSVALQKSIQSIRSIRHFSQVIHWGGYQLTGSDVKVVNEVTKRDEMVCKALGCPGGPSPFPRLELLLQLEMNLLSSEERSVQILYGPFGTDPIETVKDFIAKHHDAYKGIFWLSSYHCNVMKKTMQLIQQACQEQHEDDRSILLVLDGAAVECLSYLSPLPCYINAIIVAKSFAEYKELSKQVDLVLKRRVCEVPVVKPLTHLESSQRIVYSLVTGESSFIPGENETSHLAFFSSICSGSPPFIKLMERSLTLKLEDESYSSVIHKFRDTIQPSHNKKQPIYIELTRRISTVLSALPISSSSKLLLNVLSTFDKVPIPRALLIALENEVTKNLPFFTSSTFDSSSSCIEELMNYNCLVFYPSPIIHSSTKGSFSLNTTLCTVPDVISESVWHQMRKLDKIIAIGIAHKAVKIKGLELHDYMNGLLSQLKHSYCNISGDSSGTCSDDILAYCSDTEDLKMIENMRKEGLIELLSLFELFNFTD